MMLLWARITFSRLTTIYFTFSVLHCIVQLILQSRAFQINNQGALFLKSVVVQGGTYRPGIAYFNGRTLGICDYLSSSLDTSHCTVAWDGTPSASNIIDPKNVSSLSPSKTAEPFSATTPVVATIPSLTATSSATSTATETQRTLSVSVSSSATPSSVSISSLPNVNNAAKSSGGIKIHVLPAPLDTTDRITFPKRQFPSIETTQTENGTQVILNGYAWRDAPAVLDRRCLLALNYPLDILENTQREDIVFIAFQLWVLGMSIVALLNESIPHIFASLLTHMVATGWAGFQISHTADFKRQFVALTVEGACKPLNLLPNYWKNRGEAEISSLSFNIVALFISAVLTWKLVKLFGWQTFKRIGASLSINRCYKIVLTLSITIQLSLFFMFISVSLWLDQLFNGVIRQFVILPVLYKVASFVTLVLLIPWLMIGWFAVRREKRILMMIFLIFCIMYLAGWAFMFISRSFRWTFMQWRFFALMTSASVLLTMAALVLGIICRFNFGKGLPRYLKPQDYVESDDSIYNYGKGDGEDVEKVDFPSRSSPTILPFDSFEPSDDTDMAAPRLQDGVRSPTPVQVQSSPERRPSQGHGRHGPVENSHGKRWIIE